jgi:hypothetical protein
MHAEEPSLPAVYDTGRIYYPFYYTLFNLLHLFVLSIKKSSNNDSLLKIDYIFQTSRD